MKGAKQDVKPGQGIVRRTGWEKCPHNGEVFRAVIDFPNGPPDLPFEVVWKAQPVEITVVKPAAPQEASHE